MFVIRSSVACVWHAKLTKHELNIHCSFTIDKLCFFCCCKIQSSHHQNEEMKETSERFDFDKMNTNLWRINLNIWIGHSFKVLFRIHWDNKYEWKYLTNESNVLKIPNFIIFDQIIYISKFLWKGKRNALQDWNY